AAANAHGFHQIRQWRDDPTRDVNEPLLLAWMHPDEPDIYGARRHVMQANYDRLKAIDPNIPVTVNVSGGIVIGWRTDTLKRQDYDEFLPAVDWVTNSIYPITGWNRPEDLDAPGRTVDRLQKWTEGKPQLAVIEPSDQQLPWVPESVR